MFLKVYHPDCFLLESAGMVANKVIFQAPPPHSCGGWNNDPLKMPTANPQIHCLLYVTWQMRIKVADGIKITRQLYLKHGVFSVNTGFVKVDGIWNIKGQSIGGKCDYAR